MPLPTSGAISFNNLRTEIASSGAIHFDTVRVREIISTPIKSKVSLSEFYQRTWMASSWVRTFDVNIVSADIHNGFIYVSVGAGNAGGPIHQYNKLGVWLWGRNYTYLYVAATSVDPSGRLWSVYDEPARFTLDLTSVARGNHIVNSNYGKNSSKCVFPNDGTAIVCQANSTSSAAHGIRRFNIETFAKYWEVITSPGLDYSAGGVVCSTNKVFYIDKAENITVVGYGSVYGIAVVCRNVVNGTLVWYDRFCLLQTVAGRQAAGRPIKVDSFVKGGSDSNIVVVGNLSYDEYNTGGSYPPELYCVLTCYTPTGTLSWRKAIKTLLSTASYTDVACSCACSSDAVFWIVPISAGSFAIMKFSIDGTKIWGRLLQTNTAIPIVTCASYDEVNDLLVFAIEKKLFCLPGDGSATGNAMTYSYTDYSPVEAALQYQVVTGSDPSSAITGAVTHTVTNTTTTPSAQLITGRDNV